MPTALRIGPYRFYFYSYDCAEPRHVHVDREALSAKFWLDPDVQLEDIGVEGLLLGKKSMESPASFARWLAQRPPQQR